MAHIQFQGVQRVFEQNGQRFVALQDIDLVVQDREFVAIVGPSGCGKTTCMRMAAGLEHPTGGQVRVGSEIVTRPGPDRAVVFQSHALFPWKTVLENVAFGPKMRGDARAQREATAREFLALAGLSHAADRYPNELSGGMQQRVGVARALANHPDVLLMDEPFASVDAQTRMTLQEELARIWQERRTTILFITHDVSEAVFLANRVVVLSRGSVLTEIEVPIAHPRRWDALMDDERFKALSSQVLQKVRAA
jgi:NitT/TauT family transport system ATP-binding protein